MKPTLEQIALKYGWEDMGTQKMSSMLSFRRGLQRMNIYTTTGTVTFQNISEKYDQGQIFKEVTPEELSSILSES